MFKIIVNLNYFYKYYAFKKFALFMQTKKLIKNMCNKIVDINLKLACCVSSSVV